MRLLGARDLGLSVRWRYRFVDVGERVMSTPGVVYLDVGGALGPGLLDHHGVELDTCASRLVVDYRELVYNHLLAPWLTRFEDGRVPAGTVWRPTLVSHHDPDFDSVVAAFLVARLIEDGDLPPFAHALASYALEVDQGLYPLCAQPGEPREASVSDADGEPWQLDAVHFAYLAIQGARDELGVESTSEAKLVAGLELLGTVLEAITAARDSSPPSRVSDLLPGAPGVNAWRRAPAFERYAKLLDDDQLRFREDLSRALQQTEVELPAVDGGPPIKVQALVAGGIPKSILSKYWVRGCGFPLFICPLGRESFDQAGSAVFSRVVLSVDPTFANEERRPNLRGLGYRLERSESAARLRGVGERRRGAPRFTDGYCDNDDPWYDGRGHGWTIVDSPRGGTVLPYTEVVSLATSGDFWKVPLAGGALKLIWAEQPSGALGESGSPLQAFEGMAETLWPLYAETRESSEVANVRLPERIARRFHIEERVRTFPPGTCPSLRIVEISCGEGATLEDLLACRGAAGVRGLPDFSLARVQLGSHFSSPALVDRILSELGGTNLTPAADLSSDRELVLFGRRSIVFRQSGGAPEVSGRDTDLEILLYVAFLYLSLLSFSQRLSGLVPPGGADLRPADTRELREDFLRFQARYYQLEVSRQARPRSLFGELSTALGLPGLYTEVQSELDRLAQLEAQIDGERRERANLWIEVLLFVLAFFGVAQTVIGYLAWPERSVAVVLWLVPFLGASLGVFVWAKSRYRKRA